MARPVEPATDEAAQFESFYASHYQDILAYAPRRTETPEDAADVVAETFLTAWRRCDQAPDEAAVRLWLYGIARRVTANHIRGRRRYERLGARLRSRALATREPGPQTMGDDRAPIIEALGRLRPADREILTLVAVEGLAAAEAARVLDCSVVAARVRLHRARARFVRELRAAGVTV